MPKLGKSFTSVLELLGVRGQPEMAERVQGVILLDDLSLAAEPPPIPWIMCAAQVAAVALEAGVVQLAPRRRALRVLAIDPLIAGLGMRVRLFGTDQRTASVITDLVCFGSIDPLPTTRIQSGTRVAPGATTEYELDDFIDQKQWGDRGILVRPGEVLAVVGSIVNDFMGVSFYGVEIPDRTTPDAI